MTSTNFAYITSYLMKIGSSLLHVLSVIGITILVLYLVDQRKFAALLLKLSGYEV